jgi:hypothetical protein
MPPLSKKLVTAAGILASIIFSAQLAHAGCTRHIYNNSNNFWTFDNREILNHGSARIQVPKCGYPRGTGNLTCTIPPHTTVEIVYVTTSMADDITGTMGITDSRGVRQTFDYEGSSTFSFQDSCPYIKHDGGTGTVSVNEPANGDYSIDNDNW